MQSVISDAIVVRVIDYGEADRVATFLTRSAGKVSALARGARRSRKRFAALELFASGEARLREGRGELWALEGFDCGRGFPHLPLDMVRMAHAAYACELARELLQPHHPEPRVYELLHRLLTILDETPAEVALGTAHLRVFELSLLDALGLSPALDGCVACARDLAGEADEEGGDQLDLRRGGVVCGRCACGQGPGRRPLAPRLRRLLIRLQRTSLDDARALATLRSPAPATDIRRETWEGARDALQAVLVEHVGHVLRSVEFINKLNAVRA